VVVSGLTAGTTYRVKFVLVDWAGNAGTTASAQGSGVPESVDSGDIGPLQVGTTHLAALAVTDAKIADLSATKITTGTLSAVVALAGSFSTRVGGTGKGVTFDASGIRLFDASNNITINMDGTTGTGTFNGVLGTATISGSVLVNGSSGSRVTVTNLGGIPLIAYQTGKLIEKYPSYNFASTDSFARKLLFQAHAPGTAVFGMPSTSFVTTQFRLATIMQDGDYDNATTLASVVHGDATFLFPQFNRGDNIFANSPQITLRSHTRGADASPSNPMSEPGRRPGITFWNSETGSPGAQKGFTLQLIPTGTDANNCVLAARETDGTAGYAWLRAASFETVSARATKEEFSPVPFAALDVVRANPAQRWRFKNQPSEFYIGPIADDLPDELVTRGGTPEEIALKTTSMLGLLWQAVAELTGRLEEVEGA
jgi:hypothetical protein